MGNDQSHKAQQPGVADHTARQDTRQNEQRQPYRDDIQTERARDIVAETEHVERSCEEQAQQKRRNQSGGGEFQLIEGDPGQGADHKGCEIDSDIRVKELDGVDARAQKA